MKRLAVLPAAALAACHSGSTGTATNASTQDVANTVAAARASGAFLSPGRWETMVSFDRIELPGMPTVIAERMKRELKKTRTSASCLTKAEAVKPSTDFFGGDKSCTYEHFAMTAGKLDAKMVCRGDGIDRTMTSAGTYGSDSYRIAVASKGEGRSPMGMEMAMTVTGKRTGACAADETN